MTSIQGALLVAVHEQVLAAKIVRLPVPPCGETDFVKGLTTY
jgi:hypothetical protein